MCDRVTNDALWDRVKYFIFWDQSSKFKEVTVELYMLEAALSGGDLHCSTSDVKLGFPVTDTVLKSALCPCPP